MMRSIFVSPVIGAAGLLLLCAAAAGTTLAQMNVEQMTRSAQLVIRARCLSNSSGWDAGEIWTFSEFQVEDTWKGTSPAILTVRLLGGRAGSLVATVAGVPRFRPGEEVVLFLQPTARGDYSVVSWVQGTFRILRNSRTGEEWAAQDTTDFTLFNPTAGALPETRKDRVVPVAQLRLRVVAAANTENGRKP